MYGEEGMEESVRIPRERIGVLIGKKGKVKKRIENLADVRIRIDSKSGEVTVKGGKGTDPINFLNAVRVVKAIGRGFDPDTALNLFRDDVYLEIINLKEVLGRHAIPRQRARLIGSKGSARKRLEELTDTNIRIYGNTVSIIGTFEAIELAKRAINRLIVDGSPHTVVFRELENEKRRETMEKIYSKFGIWEKEERGDI